MFDEILAILSSEFNLLVGFYEQKQECEFTTESNHDDE